MKILNVKNRMYIYVVLLVCNTVWTCREIPTFWKKHTVSSFSSKDGDSMKMGVFWDVAPCSFVHVDRRFEVPYCIHHQDNGGSSLF
jgi:hypothetical protein